MEMLQTYSKICHNLKTDIWLDVAIDYLHDCIEDLRDSGDYHGISLYQWANQEGRTIVKGSTPNNFRVYTWQKCLEKYFKIYYFFFIKVLVF